MPEATAKVPTSEWDYCSIGQLNDALVARKLSALELLDHTIARIEALDTRFNAVPVRDFDRARDAAKAAEAALARREAWPLPGIPVTLKEPFDVAGLPSTWGFPQFRDFKPKQDALVVSRLKQAGAVIIGKTNIPTGLREFQSYNDIYGVTKNPWDVGRSPGGSSGGCAAALAAGFGPLSIGSDIGGSIRVPAHFCGVYGHKPSLGVIPLRGYSLPPAPPVPGGGDLAVLGPMTRYAADLERALDVMAAPDELRDGVGYQLKLPRPRHANLSDLRVLVIDTHPLIPTSNAVRTAIVSLGERIARLGVKVSDKSPLLPDLASSARLYMRLVAAALSPRLPAEAFADAERAAAAFSKEDHGLQAERARGFVMSHRGWLAADAARLQLQEQWRILFQAFDVVLYPPFAVPAFPNDFSEPFDARQLDIDGKSYPYLDAGFIWADPATTCGLPSTAAPIGRSPEGLPIGVQVIGPYLEDRMTIAFAGLLEREFGGFSPPLL
jgi:amidase